MSCRSSRYPHVARARTLALLAEMPCGRLRYDDELAALVHHDAVTDALLQQERLLRVGDDRQGFEAIGHPAKQTP